MLIKWPWPWPWSWSQDSVEHILLPKVQPCIFQHHSQNQTANMCAHTMARRAACTCAVQRLGSVSVASVFVHQNNIIRAKLCLCLCLCVRLCLRLWLLYGGYAMVWLRPWLWLWRSMRSMRSMHGSFIFRNRGALAEGIPQPMSCVKASQPSWHVSTVEQIGGSTHALTAYAFYASYAACREQAVGGRREPCQENDTQGADVACY
jgi:hypothetical protein